MSDQQTIPSREKVEELLLKQVAEQARNAPDDLSTASELDSFEMDSVDLINVVFAIEEEFGIDIPLGEENDFKTIGDLVDRVMTLLAEKQS